MSSTFILSFTLLLIILQVTATTFTFVNRCNYTLWPSILSYSTDAPKLNNTGFELPKESSKPFQFPAGWSGSGMFWARTGCKFDGSGSWLCQTGDCGTGLIDCNNLQPSKPITIGEFGLNNMIGDFYDVSLVSGFNVPMNFEAVGGSGTCGSAGCSVDLNRICPVELALKDGQGCMHPCEALGNSEYCCVDAYNGADLCKPNDYTEIFKDACPRSYSYAYDDQDATFQCKGGDFVVTFCPSLTSSS